MHILEPWNLETEVCMDINHESTVVYSKLHSFLWGWVVFGYTGFLLNLIVLIEFGVGKQLVAPVPLCACDGYLLICVMELSTWIL